QRQDSVPNPIIENGTIPETFMLTVEEIQPCVGIQILDALNQLRSLFMAKRGNEKVDAFHHLDSPLAGFLNATEPLSVVLIDREVALGTKLTQYSEVSRHGCPAIDCVFLPFERKKLPRPMAVTVPDNGIGAVLRQLDIDIQCRNRHSKVPGYLSTHVVLRKCRLRLI